MSDTGWKSPTVIIDDDSVGTTAWSNPSYAETSDNSYATVLTGQITSHYLKASTFGFNIPANATIDGILAEVESKSAIAGRVQKCYIVKGGIVDTGSLLTITTTTTDTYYSLGGESSLWENSWESTDINGENFGIAITSVTSDITTYVDHIQMKVFYTEKITPTVGTKYPLPAFKV